MTSVLGRHQSSDSEGYTVEQAEGLLPPGVRFELHGGRIIVTSPAKRWHTEAQRTIADLRERRGRIAGIEVGLSIAPGETRVMDVAASSPRP